MTGGSVTRKIGISGRDPVELTFCHHRAARCERCQCDGTLGLAKLGRMMDAPSPRTSNLVGEDSTIEPDNTLTMTTLPLTSPPARPKMPMQPQEGDGASSAKTSTPANNPFVTLTPAEVPMETPVPRPEETTNNQASAATTTETPNKPVDATATVATPKETSAAEAERSGHDGMIIDGEQLMVDEAIKGTAEGEENWS
ncbi:hypothetical protein quinque_009191 [Culex quinquefasciatus]